MKEYLQILKQKMKKLNTAIAERRFVETSVAKIKKIQQSKTTKIVKSIWNMTVVLGRRVYAGGYNFFNVWGTRLYKIGVKANWISWAGFGIGIFAVNFLALNMYGWALVAILLNRFCDGLDGAVARASKVTNFGVFLDATLDYIFYGGVILGFALGNSANALAACFLMFGFAAAACAMLAYSVIAFKINSKQSLNIDNSPFYLCGVAQGFETLAVMVLLCLFPQSFVFLSILLGVLSLVKAFSVIVAAYYNFVIMAKK